MITTIKFHRPFVLQFDLPRGLSTGLQVDSMDSMLEPSSAVSYSSYGGDSSTAGTGPTSASCSSRRSSMDFPFFSPYTIFRGNNNNAFWHHSSGGGEAHSPEFIHPPMLPEGVGAPAADWCRHGHVQMHGHLRHGHGGMDFLHPPVMLPQEEESLFAAYLHPPTMLPQEREQVQHVYEYGQGSIIRWEGWWVLSLPMGAHHDMPCPPSDPLSFSTNVLRPHTCCLPRLVVVSRM